MTNTKFRKRALLSSVAMLLVALVALGSATFAWYQAKMDVDADGIQMTTTASAGLLVASRSEMGGTYDDTWATWTGACTLDNGGTLTSLQPASYDQGSGNYYNITGTGPAVSTHAAGEASQCTNYIEDIVYFKLDDGTADNTSVYLNGVTLTKGTYAAKQSIIDALYPAVRVVLTKSDGTLIGEYSSAAVTESYYEAKTGDTTKGVLAASTKTTTAAQDYSAGNGILASSVGSSAAAANSVTVRVYLDGESSGVFTNNAKQLANAAAILSNLHLDFSLAA